MQSLGKKHSLNLLSCSSDSQLEAAVNGRGEAAEIMNDLHWQFNLLTCQRDEALRQVESSAQQADEARDRLAASEAALAHEQIQSKGLQQEVKGLKQQSDEAVDKTYFTEAQLMQQRHQAEVSQLQERQQSGKVQ